MRKEQALNGGRNLTIHVAPETIRGARLLAAREGTSVSRLVARTIERLVEAETGYEAARTRALELLDRGFRMGGRGRARRDSLHER
jgi:hypothetical protein